MEEILEEVKQLDLAELRTKLREHGLPATVSGPTKGLFQKRLAKKLFELQGGESPKDTDTDIKQSQESPQADVTPSVIEDSCIKSDVYYGICLPDSLETDEEVKELVFSDKVQALKVAKQFKGSRFKVFKSKDDAQQFSKLSAEVSFSSPMKTSQDGDKPKPVTESSPFKAPKVQDVVLLRRAVEKGEVEVFRESVLANPRYLVSSGDTPVLFHEACRYTALHVAAMNNKAEICRVILDTLGNAEFIEKLYSQSKNTEESLKTRMNFLLDLYLNMPDKGCCESPLHFACKFGCAEAVEVLVSHPLTDRFLKNRYGESPSDIICTRSKTTSEKEKIAELLQGQCYVPLIRSEDNTTQPLVGEPWSPGATKSPFDAVSRGHWSPKDPTLSVKACAGPMSPSSAELFRKRWTTPPSQSPDQKKKFIDMKRGDSEKGLERIGRGIAHEMHIPWQEYWHFLGMCVDLSSPKGLSHVEEFLKKRWWLLVTKQIKDQHNKPMNGATDFSNIALNFGNRRSVEKEIDSLIDSCDQLKVEGSESAMSCDSKENVAPPGGRDAAKPEALCLLSKSISDNKMDAESAPSGTNTSLTCDGTASPMSGLAARFAKLSVFDTSSSSSTGVNSDSTANQTGLSLGCFGVNAVGSVSSMEVQSESNSDLRKALAERLSVERQTSQTGTEGSSVSSYKSFPSISESSYKTAEENTSDSVFEQKPALCFTVSWRKELEQFLPENFDSQQGRDVESSILLIVRLKSCKDKNSAIVDIINMPDKDSVEEVKLLENILAVYSEGDISRVEDGDIVELSVCEDQDGVSKDWRLDAYFYRTFNVSMPSYSFLYGLEPTREDLDVARALEDVFISPELYPNLLNWTVKMNQYTEDTSYRWQSPAKMRPRSYTSNLMKTSPLYKSSPVIPYGSPVGQTGRPSSRSNLGNSDIRTKLFPSIIE